MNINNEYLKLVKQARNKELKLLQESYKEIQQLYKEVSKDLLIKSKKANKGSLNERWLKDYKKAIKKSILETNKILYKNISDKIKKSTNLQSRVQLDFFSLIDHKYNLGMQQTFKNMFSKVPEEVVKELINGNIYKDGRGLSKRIWFANNKVNGDIQHIINKGIIEKKSAYELAKDIETYVNPQAKQDFKWKKVYPNVGNKKVDFNAQRLARTSINHAYFMSNVRSCSKNPFVEAMHWELSLQHFIRMHGRTDICDEYANSDNYNLGTGNFPINKLPLPHPQCICIQYAVIPDSLEDIGTRLNKWVNGASDNTLDEWFNKYGQEFAGEGSIFSEKSNKINVSKIRNSDIIKSESKEEDNFNHETIKSKVQWEKYLEISTNNSQVLNNIHTSLNQFMHVNNREKLVLLDIENNRIVHELEGEKDDEVTLTKETKKLLRNSSQNSIVFIHNHPSKTTFSRYDIYQMVKFKSVNSMTLECTDGSKFIIERGKMKSSILNDFNFPTKYDRVYWQVAKKYPELDDEVKINEIWDEFLHEVTKEVAKVYGMNYKKVIE